MVETLSLRTGSGDPTDHAKFVEPLRELYEQVATKREVRYFKKQDTRHAVWPKAPTAKRSTLFRHGHSLNLELSAFNLHSLAWCAAQTVLFRFGIPKNKPLKNRKRSMFF
jgi:hypothetical protein